MIRKLFGIQLYLLMSIAAHAGTIVDLQDQNKKQTQFLSDGKFGRMNSTGDRNYMIVDYASESIKVVMPDRQEVLDLSGEMPTSADAGANNKRLRLEVEDTGDGPEIAGYATKSYRLLANGKTCGTVYASQQAMEDTGLDKMFKTLQKVTEKTSNAMPEMQPVMGECERAKLNTADHIEKMGAPLRSLDQDGKVEIEVTQIRTDVELPPDSFNIPSDYKVVSAADKLKQAEEQLRNGIERMQQKMPQVEKMLEDMEKSGKMSPEAMKNMRQLMEKYQKPQ